MKLTNRSSTGIVNVYSSSSLSSGPDPLEIRPNPLKSLEHLTISITTLAFHPSSELLVTASKTRRDQLKLVCPVSHPLHIPFHLLSTTSHYLLASSTPSPLYNAHCTIERSPCYSIQVLSWWIVPSPLNDGIPELPRSQCPLQTYFQHGILFKWGVSSIG